MADSTITGLTEDTTPTGVDLVYTGKSPFGAGDNKKVTLTNIGKGLNAGVIPNTPAGGIAATDIQAAINELDTEKAAINADTTGKSGSTDALNSATTSVDVSAATAPTAGQVLTATGGTAATWQTAGGGFSPTRLSATSFETAGRFTTLAAAGGTNTFGTFGLVIATNTTVGGRSGVTNLVTSGSPSQSGFLGSPKFSTSTVIFNSAATNWDSFFGLGNPALLAGGITFTDAHIGFKIIWTGAGNIDLFATQADGTTENASSVLTTVLSNDVIDLMFVVNGSSSVDYYWNKNATGWSSATNLTTNTPVGVIVSDVASFMVTNKNQSQHTSLSVNSASYER